MIEKIFFEVFCLIVFMIVFSFKFFIWVLYASIRLIINGGNFLKTQIKFISVDYPEAFEDIPMILFCNGMPLARIY